jgi:CHAT domain-containing protein
LHGRTRFLSEDYVISLLPSAALFAAGRATRLPGHLLALAPASAHLRFAGEEAQSITRYFRGDRITLIGPRATESAFKRSAERYQVIHLATHGFFNKFNPMFSGVQLERDRENDGRLEVHEILGLRLGARLVTLSACETALGSGYFSEFPVGDDFVGLTQAFLSAGADAVLSSLWQVDDRSSMELIRTFYARRPHQDPANALAYAQRLTLRSGGLFSHPYHWAGFVLIGTGSVKDIRRKKPDGIRVSRTGVARPSIGAAER